MVARGRRLAKKRLVQAQAVKLSVYNKQRQKRRESFQQVNALLPPEVGVGEEALWLDTQDPINSPSFDKALCLLENRCVGVQRRGAILTDPKQLVGHVPRPEHFLLQLLGRAWGVR